MSTIRIVDDPHAPDSVKEIVRDSLDFYNVAVTGLSDYAPVALFLKDEHEEVRGGLLGDIWGGWLRVAILWVAEGLRGHGYGQMLLAAAERRGVERGCRHVYLDTFSFQAPEFYKKLGYEVFAEVPDWPPGQTHYFLRKELAPDPADARTRS
ncbi:MAG TPA: GNAT family N-acetyltransferase [Methylomirabilota bacterium]|nr:GNAT family N-acetyltransferase [Methylomirabilota bacterium]